MEDPETLGFHHVHLSAADPAATLKWYQNALGGTPASLKGRVNGLRFGNVWLLAARHEEGVAGDDARDAPSITSRSSPRNWTTAVGRSAAGSKSLRRAARRAAGRAHARRSVRLSPRRTASASKLVEPGFAGVKSGSAPAAVTTDRREPYTTPRTPWGEPDLQGVYTGNSAHGIPLERPKDLADVKTLTAEQAAARQRARHAGQHLGLRAGVARHDARLREDGAVHAGGDGHRSARRPDAADDAGRPRSGPKRRADGAPSEETPSGALTGSASAGGPEDLSSFVRCITRGLPGMMMPAVYNNGLQIVQGPGFVAIQKEMIHETRVIPTHAA